MTQDEPQPTPSDSESKSEALERRIHDQPTVAPGKWVKRAVIVIVLIAVGYIAYRMSAAFFPRWWAQRVADQVQGRMTAGVLWGLFYGFVFSFIPLLLLFQIRRRFFNWVWRGITALIAIALAAPNWLTLSVVVLNSKAAHAGERILDVDGPGFRWASLAGVIVGSLLAIVVTGTNIRLASRKKQVKELKGERDQLKAQQRGSEEKSES